MNLQFLRGKFLVFDGGEGCGKSTQAQILRHELEAVGVPVVPVRDPGTTRIGELIRGILLNPENEDMNMRCEMLLYMAARAQMMAQVVLPALADGAVVISDRFVSSTLAYQLGGDGLAAGQIREVADIALKGRWPDLTIILDMPVEASSQRVLPKFLIPLSDDSVRRLSTKDRIEQRPLAYHEQVRQNYLRQASENPDRYHVIRADRNEAVVHADVLAALATLK